MSYLSSSVRGDCKELSNKVNISNEQLEKQNSLTPYLKSQGDERRLSISCIIATYGREDVLVQSIKYLLPQLQEGDCILVMDQSSTHEKKTVAAIFDFAKCGHVRWFKTKKVGKGPALNYAAIIASTDLLLIVDDDIIPSTQLLQEHRDAYRKTIIPPAVCGQVLQPWQSLPVNSVDGYDIQFNVAYSQDADICNLIGCNFSVWRSVFIEMGGMDENYQGYLYRDDSDMAYRICEMSGQKIRFVANASLRHLQAGTGGNRNFGRHNTWGDIGGAIGDYYFALRRLKGLAKIQYILRRIVKEPINRGSVKRPWIIPLLYVREISGFFKALFRIYKNPDNFIKPVSEYEFSEIHSTSLEY